jgi:hypothetical protein
MGRIRLQVVLDCSAYSLDTFVLHNVEPGSTIATDSWESYNFIEDAQCAHEKSNQSSSKNNESLYGYSAKQNQATHAELNHTPDIEKRPSC